MSKHACVAASHIYCTEIHIWHTLFKHSFRWLTFTLLYPIDLIQVKQNSFQCKLDSMDTNGFEGTYE